jgi:hypothetical protein
MDTNGERGVFGGELRSASASIADSAAQKTPPRRRPSTGRGLVIVAFSFRVGHLTRDIGLLALGTGFQALPPLGYPLQSLAFTRRRRALAFVRAPLSFIC